MNLGFRVVAESQPVRDTVSVVICGDVMLDGGPGHEVVNGVDPFKDFSPLFQSADISICNLECVLASGGEVLQKAYTFRGADGSLPLLKKHFSAVSLANNHSADFGLDTFVRQLEMLETGGLAHFGGGRNLDAARKPLIIERNGQRIAFLGYNGFNPTQYSATADKPGVGPLDVEMMTADIRRARSEYKADIVIPYVHWGRELVPSPRATKYNASVFAGATAARNAALPGIAIGVGGRPARVYVFHGVSVCKSCLRRLPSNRVPMP